jgi:hypothetical protein
MIIGKYLTGENFRITEIVLSKIQLPFEITAIPEFLFVSLQQVAIAGPQPLLPPKTTMPYKPFLTYLFCVIS